MKKFNWNTALPAILFCGLLAALSLWNLAAPKREFSETENRSLAQLPRLSQEALLSGQLMADFESYAQDQFLFRDNFMSGKTALDQLLLRKENGKVYFGKDGYLFSTDVINEKQKTANLTLVSDFLKKIRTTKTQKAPIQTSVLLIPTAKSVLPELLPAFAPVSDEKAAIAQAEAVITAADPDLCFTNPSQALSQAAHGGNAAGLPENTLFYYRTDHHWTTDGAYIAYCRWALDNGLDPVATEDLQRTVVSDSFLGTNQAKAPGAFLQADSIAQYTLKESDRTSEEQNRLPLQITVWNDITRPEETEQRNSFYDDPALDTKDQYAYFLGGNYPQLRIRTGLSNGRRLLLVKDSYANCMIPFLALHYEEITVTDLRYSHGKIFKDKDFTDILFLYNIESFCNDRNLAYLTYLADEL